MLVGSWSKERFHTHFSGIYSYNALKCYVSVCTYYFVHTYLIERGTTSIWYHTVIHPIDWRYEL